MMENISDEINTGSMPLPVYTMIHRKAKLDAAQVEVIVSWTEAYTESLFGE